MQEDLGKLSREEHPLVGISYASSAKQEWIQKYDKSLKKYKLVSKQINSEGISRPIRDFFVEELCSVLKNSEIVEPYIDKNDIELGDSITEFEKKLGKCKIIIVVLSDKYFTSPHCMFEWKKIHEQELYKKIIYVIDKQETVFVGGHSKWNGFDLKDDKYKSLLYDRWCVYMKKVCSEYYKSNNNIGNIITHTFKNHFYFEDINKIQSKLDDSKSIRFCLGSDSDCGGIAECVENLTKKICANVTNYVEGKNVNDKYWERCIENALWHESILVVGDNVLKMQQDGKFKRLGDIYEENGFNDIPDGKPDNSEFRELLDIKSFNIVFSFGYSKKILRECQDKFSNSLTYRVLNGNVFRKHEDAREKKLSVLRYICEKYSETDSEVKNTIDECEDEIDIDVYENFKEKLKINPKIQFPESIFVTSDKYSYWLPTDQLISNGEFNKVINSKEYLEWRAKKDNYNFNSDFTKNRIAYYEMLDFNNRSSSEKEIVDLINRFLVAVANEKIPSDRYVLIVGAKFPGWALRFVWNALTDKYGYKRLASNNSEIATIINNSFIDNKEVDDDTVGFVKDNGGVFFFDDDLNKFFSSLSSIKEKYIRCIDSTKINVFVSYIKGNEDNFKSFVDNYLIPIEKETLCNEKIHFVWRTLYDDNDRLELLLKESRLHIFYHDDHTADLLPAPEGDNLCDYNFDTDYDKNNRLIIIPSEYYQGPLDRGAKYPYYIIKDGKKEQCKVIKECLSDESMKNSICAEIQNLLNLKQI